MVLALLSPALSLVSLLPPCPYTPSLSEHAGAHDGPWGCWRSLTRSSLLPFRKRRRKVPTSLRPRHQVSVTRLPVPRLSSFTRKVVCRGRASLVSWGRPRMFCSVGIFETRHCGRLSARVFGSREHTLLGSPPSRRSQREEDQPSWPRAVTCLGASRRHRAAWPLVFGFSFAQAALLFGRRPEALRLEAARLGAVLRCGHPKAR